MSLLQSSEDMKGSASSIARWRVFNDKWLKQWPPIKMIALFSEWTPQKKYWKLFYCAQPKNDNIISWDSYLIVIGSHDFAAYLHVISAVLQKSVIDVVLCKENLNSMTANWQNLRPITMPFLGIDEHQKLWGAFFSYCYNNSRK